VERALLIAIDSRLPAANANKGALTRPEPLDGVAIRT
jgi:hypothetical protein